jgi:hypothetical protein
MGRVPLSYKCLVGFEARGMTTEPAMKIRLLEISSGQGPNV